MGFRQVIQEMVADERQAQAKERALIDALYPVPAPHTLHLAPQMKIAAKDNSRQCGRCYADNIGSGRDDGKNHDRRLRDFPRPSGPSGMN